jgi:hypothetical protein
MDPRDVNRINYNNYYVGQNLDFLVRSKMRSESLSTPLKNTPPFYDDQVSSKMSLLGKRGYYDPGYIYGFPYSNQSENGQYEQDNLNNMNPNEGYLDDPNQVLTREQYDQVILPKERYKEQMLNNYELNNNQKNNNYKYQNENNSINNERNERNKYNDEMIYRQRLEMMKERQTPQKLDNFQLDRIIQNRRRSYEEEQNNNINDKERKNIDEPKYGYDKSNDEREREYYYEQVRKNYNKMERNQDKIPNKDYYKQISEYNYINELSKKNTGDLVLPLTKNQILQEVYTENFNRKQNK